MARWRLNDAQKRFPEVVERALTEGPQTIAVARGRSVVVSSKSKVKSRPPKPRRTPTVIEALLAAPHVPGFKIPQFTEVARPATFQ